jgi:hypothetical protein
MIPELLALTDAGKLLAVTVFPATFVTVNGEPPLRFSVSLETPRIWKTAPFVNVAGGAELKTMVATPPLVVVIEVTFPTGLTVKECDWFQL